MKNTIKLYLLAIGLSLFLTSCAKNQPEYANKEASITTLGELPENPLLLTPMAALTNRRDNSISMLYGNGIAVQHAREYANDKYPPGSLLYKVTWQAKPDSLWFGATIPKQVKLVERVMVNNENLPLYTSYKGRELAETKITDHRNIGVNTESILHLKMAVSP